MANESQAPTVPQLAQDLAAHFGTGYKVQNVCATMAYTLLQHPDVNSLPPGHLADVGLLLQMVHDAMVDL